jgi:hypothetical protein
MVNFAAATTCSGTVPDAVPDAGSDGGIDLELSGCFDQPSVQYPPVVHQEEQHQLHNHWAFHRHPLARPRLVHQA